MIPQLYKCFEHWAAQGTVWIYSDPHFADPEAANYNRIPDEEQVRLINSKVGRKDTLIILGDIGSIEWAKKLRGYKVLVCGNHDAGATNYEEVFNEIYTGPLFIGERLLLSHEPIDFPFALNLHGHCHNGQTTPHHINCCSNVINYTPINLNQLLKTGVLSKIESIHRSTIDDAIKRKKKRNKKK
jgi:calcineurin-like phosphoesterase family protein